MDFKNRGIAIMDQKSAIKMVKRYIRLIPPNYQLINAYLFGSYAKNNFSKDSDIDIALILKNVQDDFQMQIELMKLRRKVDMRIEPHPIDESDYNFDNPLVTEILQHGIKIV